MRKLLIFTLLLILGLIASQLLPVLGEQMHEAVARVARVATMVALAFIMIHVGQEFDLDKSNLRRYGWDYLVAASAATLPWLLVATYFMFALTPQSLWGELDAWKRVLVQGRFAAPTATGVLFAMLTAAGLGASWVYQKARVLVIFDDLDTILLLIPLKMLLVGFKWQLWLVLVVSGLLLWAAWKYLHVVRIPRRWPWVLGYAASLALISEGIYLLSGWLEPGSPIHFEVVLPAFVLGCIMARPQRELAAHVPGAAEQPGLGSGEEQHVSTAVAAIFMFLVGLSMPAIVGGGLPIGAESGIPARPPTTGAELSWGALAGHVVAVTFLANLGKMVPAVAYRKQAPLRDRLALAVSMFPRGEVGAGILVMSLAYGITGPAMTVALLSLALNLLLTGVYVVVVRKMVSVDVGSKPRPQPSTSPVLQHTQTA